MPYTITWLDNDEHCIVIRPFGTWSWEEFERTYAEAHAAVASKDHVVDYIADLSTLRHAPGPNFLSSAYRAYNSRPSNAGLAVIVNPPMAVQVILDVVAKTLGKIDQFRFVHTMTEAVGIVTQQRARRGETQV